MAPARQAFRDPTEMIVVEGESDCWSAWSHGVRALGIPGSDQTAVLNAEHLALVETVYIQREKVIGPNPTFPKGVDHFVDEIAKRLVLVGFSGAIRILEMPDPFSDMSDMHISDPSTFDERLTAAKANSVLIARSR
jgi:hypothetical protein